MRVKQYFFLLVSGVLFLSLHAQALAYTNGMAADLVIGEPDFTETNGLSTDSCPLVNDQTLCGPEGMIIVGNKLIVADRGNREF